MSKEINNSKLRRYNIIAGVFHLLQMVAVLALSNDFTLPIVARYMSGPPGSTFAEPITLLNTPSWYRRRIIPWAFRFLPFLSRIPKVLPSLQRRPCTKPQLLPLG